MHQPEGCGTGDQPIHRLIHRPPVGKTGQRVGQRLFLGGGLGLLEAAVQVVQLLHHRRFGLGQIKHLDGQVGRCKIGFGQVMRPNRIGDLDAERQVDQGALPGRQWHGDAAKSGAGQRPQVQVETPAGQPQQICHPSRLAGAANREQIEERQPDGVVGQKLAQRRADGADQARGQDPQEHRHQSGKVRDLDGRKTGWRFGGSHSRASRAARTKGRPAAKLGSRRSMVMVSTPSAVPV